MGAGTTPDLVQHHQTARRRLAQDARRLGHLDQEGAGAAARSSSEPTRVNSRSIRPIRARKPARTSRSVPAAPPAPPCGGTSTCRPCSGRSRSAAAALVTPWHSSPAERDSRLGRSRRPGSIASRTGCRPPRSAACRRPRTLGGTSHGPLLRRPGQPARQGRRPPRRFATIGAACSPILRSSPRNSSRSSSSTRASAVRISASRSFSSGVTNRSAETSDCRRWYSAGTDGKFGAGDLQVVAEHPVEPDLQRLDAGPLRARAAPAGPASARASAMPSTSSSSSWLWPGRMIRGPPGSASVRSMVSARAGQPSIVAASTPSKPPFRRPRRVRPVIGEEAQRLGQHRDLTRSGRLPAEPARSVARCRRASPEQRPESAAPLAVLGHQRLDGIQARAPTPGASTSGCPSKRRSRRAPIGVRVRSTAWSRLPRTLAVTGGASQFQVAPGASDRGRRASRRCTACGSRSEASSRWFTSPTYPTSAPSAGRAGESRAARTRPATRP